MLETRADAALAQDRLEVLWNPEETLYNHCVRALPGTSIYQAYSWGDIRGSQGLTPHRLVIRDAQGEPCAAVTWLERTLPLGRCLLLGTRGPLWRPDRAAALVRLLEETGRLARARKALALRINPSVPAHPETIRLLGEIGLRPVRWRRLPLGGTLAVREWQVPLGSSLQAVWNGLHPDHRRMVRRADREGIRIELGRADELPALWKQVWWHARRKGLPLRGDAALTRMAQVWLARGEGVLLLARRRGEVVGASLSTCFGSEALGHFVVDDGRARRDGVTHALYWQFLSWAHGQGAQVANLGGIAAHPGRPGNAGGLEPFKRHFGGQAVTYVGEWDAVPDPSAYRVFRTMERLVCG